MNPAQEKAIQKAINDYKLKVELIHAEHERRIREILEQARKSKISSIRNSLTS